MKAKSVWHISSESESKRRRHTLISRKESKTYFAPRDRTKKLERASHIMDVSLAQFGRILKNVWKEDGWVENHLSSCCIFGFVLCCGERCSFGGNKWLLCPLWGPSTYNSKLLLFLKTHLLQDFIAPFFRQICISHFSPRNICIFLLFLFCSQTCTCILWRGSFQRCKQIQGWSWEFPRQGLRKKRICQMQEMWSKIFPEFPKIFPRFM